MVTAVVVKMTARKFHMDDHDFVARKTILIIFLFSSPHMNSVISVAGFEQMQGHFILLLFSG